MDHYRRDWLNKSRGTAFVESTTHAYMPRKKDKPGYVSASLAIADCSRTVHLDFDSSNKEEVDERIHKIRILRLHLDQIENALLSARPVLFTRKQCEALDKKERSITVRTLDIEAD